MASVALYATVLAPALNAADVPYQPLARILDTYAEGRYNEALPQLFELTDFQGLTRGFQKEAPKWIAATGVATKERRSHVVAIVALEIARLGFIGERLSRAQFEDAMTVLEFGCALVRSGEPDPFEHLWLLSSWALIQGAQNFFLSSRNDEKAIFSVHWRHAQSRFPAEGRFRLAEILTKPEARRMPNAAGTSSFSMTNGSLEKGFASNDPAGRVRAAINGYGRLLDDHEIAPEARLRRGILLFHRADLRGTLADVQAAISSSSDPDIVYVSYLYEGLALDELGRFTDAILAYESALRVVPHARSAALLLAEDLSAARRHEEAAELLQNTFSSPAAHDPWVELSAGDYRFWARDLEQLREAVRP